MNYKSVGLAAGVALLGAALPALGANSMETKAFTSGLDLADNGVYRLESTVGEVAGSSMAAASKGLRPGHSGTSHSPGVPYDFSASTTAATEALFQWTNAGSEGLSGQASYVEIKIATYSITYANYSTVTSSLTLDALASGTADQTMLGGLVSGKTYYVAIRVRDSSNMYGRISLSSFATTPVRPRAPVVTGVLSGGNFTLSWPAVQYNAAGSTITIKNYELYSSTALNGVVSAALTLSSSTLSRNVSSTPAKWYFVKAVDSDDFRSDASIWLNSAEDIVRTVADDQRAVVDMTPAIESELKSGGLTTAILRQSQQENGNTILAYKFYLVDGSNHEYTRDLGGDVTLTMPLSKTGTFSVSGFGPSAAYTSYDYAVYYFNGVEDVKLGGTVNPSDGTISILTRKTGLFKVKQVIRAQSFRITQTVPKKIFTPNGDGIWDEFNIIFENPEGLEISAAKVYDLSGAEVASLRVGTYNAEASLAWDGRRKGGDKAMSGIYIYQFKAGDKTYNGTVVLAR